MIDIMDSDWEAMRQMLPALEMFPSESKEELEDLFRSIYSIGWMSGNLAGHVEGMRSMIPVVSPLPNKSETEN